MERILEAAFETHPGVALAKMLKEKSISPSDFSKCLTIHEEMLNEILAGQRDIDEPLSVYISGCLNEERPERWITHQHKYNQWKKSQL